MKIRIKILIKTASLIIAMITSIPLSAYKYTFINATNKSFLLGIKFDEINAPIYPTTFTEKQIVKPQKTIVFVQGKEFPSIKWSACLKTVEFITEPTTEHIKNPNSHWKPGILLSLDKATLKKVMETTNQDTLTKLLHQLTTSNQTQKLCSHSTVHIIESQTGTPYFLVEK